MTGKASAEIAVIGAGVIGLTIAYRLARAGREVVIVDPNPPGSGASYGNAGTVADYAVMPVGTPAVLRNLPSLLFDRNSPLAIRRAAIFALAPWLLRFARQSLPGAAARNAQAIAGLVAGAGADWLELAGAIGGADILQSRGCLYMYETAAGFAGARADMAYRRGFGISAEVISAEALAAMEPGLPEAKGAAFFPQARFMTDPGAMVGLLAAAAVAEGAVHLPCRVERLARGAGGVLLEGPGLNLTTSRVVIAAGAHSKRLAAMAGDRVPLETERGYHVEYDSADRANAPRLTRPTCPTSRGFYVCPMQGRLRVAGTVELGGLDPTPSQHRIAMLDKGARAIFPDLPPPSRSWLGFRPSMPDSLPVLGPSRQGADILHAYGHGHIGLTLAPITARIIADLILGKPAELTLAAYSAQRF